MSLDEILEYLTRTVLHPALIEAGVEDPEQYRVEVPRKPLRGCEHRTLTADFPSGFAPVVPDCGCLP